MADVEDTQPDPLLGRVLAGKLRLEQRLGAGASGAVYRAWHETLEKRIAIKVLHASHGADPALASRFKSEARAASRLDHPCSVRILDFGEDGPDRLLYIAMEFLDGEDLQSLIDREGTISEARTCVIMAQVVGALVMAHDQGIVHRDMKPGNVMLLREQTEDGERELVKVCDFGLAKILDVKPEDLSHGPLTKQGTIFGTPAYMAPEQASGDPVDGQADLYACGVILFRMLTGRAPFTAETITGLLMKHILEPAPKVASLAPGLDPRLVALIDRLLLKRAADRPSGREVLAELRSVAQSAKVPLPRIPTSLPNPSVATISEVPQALSSPVTTPPRSPSQAPLIWAAVVGSLALMGVGALAAYLAFSGPAPRPDPSIPVAPVAAPKIEAPPVAEASPKTEAPVVAEAPKTEAPRLAPKPEPKVTATKKEAPPPASNTEIKPVPKPEPVVPQVPAVIQEPPVAAPPDTPPPVTPPPPEPPRPMEPPKPLVLQVRLAKWDVGGGLSRRESEAAMQKGFPALEACVARILGPLKVPVAGEISGSGEIDERRQLGRVQVKGNLKGAELCVDEAYRSVRFPRPDTGTAPLSFRVTYQAQ